MITPSSFPLFIVGVHRSGTTLLRYMLSSSSHLYIPPESDFIPRFFLGRPEKTLTRRDVQRMLDMVFDKYRFVSAWTGDRPDVDQFMTMMAGPTPAAFLNTLYGLYAAQYQAERWGDKTPIYASYIDLISRIFPEARFVHIIRDGRDVALSMLDKWGDKEPHVDIFFTARNWVRRIAAAQKEGSRLGPERYYELYYEDLVRTPEHELQQLCLFIEEPFVPEMVEQHRLARKQLPAGGFHEAVRHPPSKARIERWKEEMTAADLRLFQFVAGDMLRHCGYELADAGEMSLAESMRLAALALKYATLQSGRRVLQAAGVMPPI